MQQGRKMNAVFNHLFHTSPDSVNINTDQFSLANIQHLSSVKTRRINYFESSLKIKDTIHS